jgi:protoporphyrinogen oxidase
MYQKHWGIIGGGILGMDLARQLRKLGHEVTILEGAKQMGGLAGAWKFDDFVWDKFYHVILLSDSNLRGLIAELGLDSELQWVETKTGFYARGRLHSMSTTLEFLRFPLLRLHDRFRLGFTIFYASKVKRWQRLETILVSDWLRRLSGTRAFNTIWLPLLRAKLGEAYRNTAATFIWATIQRMYAARRTGLKKEMFGYVKGGYARILDELVKKLNGSGVEMLTGCAIDKVDPGPHGRVKVTDQQGNSRSFDKVIVTVPSPRALEMCNGLSNEEKDAHNRIEYVGVICASLLLKRKISPYYVTNIIDDTPFTGIIEMTNIVDPAYFDGNQLIYLPKYVKRDDPLFSWSDQKISDFFWSELRRMYPELKDEDLVAIQIARTPFVFALPTLEYSSKLPALATSIPGVYILNSARIINGTLNVNETLQLSSRELPDILNMSS